MNFLESVARDFFMGAAQLVWPISCPVCGGLGVHVCEECLESVMSETPLFCLECGTAVPCGRHPGGPVVRAASFYSGAAKELVRVMKYENGRKVAIMTGELMASRFARPDADFLVPVPLHKSSERDYNQAELIACGAADVWGLTAVPLLKWKRDVSRQALKSGAGTRDLPEDAMDGDADLRGFSVYIVDDVFTSGNTMRAAARALERLGASISGAMVWSRSGG